MSAMKFTDTRVYSDCHGGGGLVFFIQRMISTENWQYGLHKNLNEWKIIPNFLPFASSSSNSKCSPYNFHALTRGSYSTRHNNPESIRYRNTNVLLVYDPVSKITEVGTKMQPL